MSCRSFVCSPGEWDIDIGQLTFRNPRRSETSPSLVEKSVNATSIWSVSSTPIDETKTEAGLEDAEETPQLDQREETPARRTEPVRRTHLEVLNSWLLSASRTVIRHESLRSYCPTASKRASRVGNSSCQKALSTTARSSAKASTARSSERSFEGSPWHSRSPFSPLLHRRLQ